MSITIRIVLSKIGELSELTAGLEPVVEQILAATRGIAFITGVTGSGKWTVLTALVAELNRRRADRIYIISSYANYAFESGRGLPTQIYVGQDCDTYVDALEIAHRSDPDIIAIDDLPTEEVLRLALGLAESGHLVLCNLHAESPLTALRQLADTFGAYRQAFLESLARNLLVVTGQRLLLIENGKRRVPVYQWIGTSGAVREALVRGDWGEVATLQGNDPSCRVEPPAL